jgi:hypothetical protein
MNSKRKLDIVELGEKPVIKKQHFDSAAVLRVKRLGRDKPQLAIREFRARLEQEFPDKHIPKATATHKILKGSGFKMIKLSKKTLIWPRNQLKRFKYCLQRSCFSGVRDLER